MNEFKVSVVIPTKNAGTLFRKVLDSVISQKTEWLFEVLVVDSGSTDGTVDLVKSISSVKLLEIPSCEFGHGKTRNYAIAHTTGDYIAMITQDALPATDNWLNALFNKIESDQHIAGVFGRHCAYPEASIFTKHELEQHFNGFLTQPVVELDDQDRYQYEEGYRQFLYFFSDNNAFIRKSVWEKIPYPEVDFAEDQAWAKLIIEAGYRKAYAHDALVYHSHNYGLVERLQRSFDEAYSLRRLFNYQHGRGFRHAIRSFIAITLRDFRFALIQKNLIHYFGQILLMPLDNFMRITGHYLGANGSSLPKVVRLYLSRDRRLQIQ